MAGNRFSVASQMSVRARRLVKTTVRKRNEVGPPPSSPPPDHVIPKNSPTDPKDLQLPFLPQGRTYDHQHSQRGRRDEQLAHRLFVAQLDRLPHGRSRLVRQLRDDVRVDELHILQRVGGQVAQQGFGEKGRPQADGDG